MERPGCTSPTTAPPPRLHQPCHGRHRHQRHPGHDRGHRHRRCALRQPDHDHGHRHRRRCASPTTTTTTDTAAAAPPRPRTPAPPLRPTPARPRPWTPAPPPLRQPDHDHDHGTAAPSRPCCIARRARTVRRRDDDATLATMTRRAPRRWRTAPPAGGPTPWGSCKRSSERAVKGCSC